ncbi:MAG TPA: hypothetical protein VJ731_11570 [Terriglobales bacterium]|nr:hypothetical protein [Terriglobales bacterium]
MCDYSLFEHPNRLAVEGEELVTYRFPSRTLGLASVRDLKTAAEAGTPFKPSGMWSILKSMFASEVAPAPVAVCVPPCARLSLCGIPAPFRLLHRLSEREEATFVQSSMSAHTHRDGIRFDNGRQTLLQDLPEGLHVWVVALGGDEEQTPFDLGEDEARTLDEAPVRG